jgi:hypothetical protein
LPVSAAHSMGKLRKTAHRSFIVGFIEGGFSRTLRE